MKLLVFWMSIMMIARADASDAGNTLLVEVDLEKLLYRAVVRFEDGSVEYDANDLRPIASGLSPRRVRAFVSGESGKLIPTGNSDGGYSSYQSSSELTYRTMFLRASAERLYKTEWLKIEDLLRGFEIVSGVGAQHWVRLQIKCEIGLRGRSTGLLTGYSPWIELPVEKRLLLSRRLQPK